MSSNSEKLLRISKSINKEAPTLMLLLASMQSNNIKNRTSGGVDASGQPFIPYSTAYAKFKERVRGNLDWLQLSGDMMNAIIPALMKERVGSKLLFTSSGNSDGKFNQNKMSWNNKKRNFWAISSEEVEALSRYGFSYLQGVIDNA